MKTPSQLTTKIILIPTDFSPAAKNAADYAVQLAKVFHAEVVLLHVYHVPIPVSDVPIITITPQELQEANEEQLKTEVTRLSEPKGVKISFSAVMGMAVDEILYAARKADLLVMGIEGMGRLSEILIGSTTTAVMRQTDRPILVIPKEARFKPLEKLGLACAYDSESDQNSLDMLKKISKHFHSDLFILQVKSGDEKITVEEAVNGLHLEHELADIPHQFYLREGTDPTEGINSFVEDYDLDLIAVMPHHQSFFERLLNTSVSKHLAFHTRIPMLTLPQV